jgi:hypothetical protein
MGLGTAGTANAETRATAACSTFQVGDSQNYTAPGNVNVGNISQLYDSCTGDTIAQWIWDYSFVQAHGDSYIQLSLASMGSNKGVTGFPTLQYASQAASTNYVLQTAEPHSYATPDSWRAGAELDGSGCVAWTSQHYYAIGAETAGPYAGCNDDHNLTQIPWTQP